MKRQLSGMERLAQHQRRTLGVGRDPVAAVVVPIPAPGIARINDQPPITNAGPMSAGRSTPWHVIRGGHTILTVMFARSVAIADSTFQWRLNDVLVGDVMTWPAGDALFVHSQTVDTIPHDIVDLECLTAGAGLGDIGGRGELNG